MMIRLVDDDAKLNGPASYPITQTGDFIPGTTESIEPENRFQLRFPVQTPFFPAQAVV